MPEEEGVSGALHLVTSTVLPRRSSSAMSWPRSAVQPQKNEHARQQRAAEQGAAEQAAGDGGGSQVQFQVHHRRPWRPRSQLEEQVGKEARYGAGGTPEQHPKTVCLPASGGGRGGVKPASLDISSGQRWLQRCQRSSCAG